jgi:hypothetical protein
MKSGMNRALSLLWGPTLGALLLILMAPAIPLDGQWVIDNGARWLQTEAIRQHVFQSGQLRTDVPWPGQRVSPDLALIPCFPFQYFERDGRVFLQYPPSFATLVAGLTWLAGSWGERIPGIFGGILLLWGLQLWGRRLQLRHPTAMAVSTLFLTPLLPYAHTLWDVLPCIALGVVATYLMSGTRPISIVAGGVLAGVAFVLREEYIVWSTAMVLTLVTLRQWGAAVLVAGGFAAVFLPTVLVNQLTIGKPLYMLLWSTQEGAMLQWTWQSRGLVAYYYLVRFGPIPPTTLTLLADVVMGLLVLLGVALMVRGRGPRTFWAGVACLVLGTIYPRLMVWGFEQALLRQHNGTSALGLLPLVFLGLVPWSRPLSPFDGKGVHDGDIALREGSSVKEAPIPGVEVAREDTSSSSPSGIVAGWSGEDDSDGADSLVYLRRSVLVFTGLFLLTSPTISAIGYHFGPRLLLPALPALALLSWWALERLAHLFPQARMVWLVAAVVALADTGFSVHRLVLKTTLSRDLGRLLIQESTPGTPILTQRTWVGLDMPILWRDRILLGADRGRDGLAVRVARSVAPQALYIGGSQIPISVVQAADRIERLQLFPRIIFPDESFFVAVYRIGWKADSASTTGSLATVGGAGS